MEHKIKISGDGTSYGTVISTEDGKTICATSLEIIGKITGGGIERMVARVEIYIDEVDLTLESE